MKIYLLPESGNFYKANLHCHSTISDGRWSPEEIKENYKAAGYSIVAYTDHQVFLTHNDLADESFLPLNGYELDITQKKIGAETPKTCHICFVALDKDRTVQKIFYNSKHLDNNIEKADLAPDRQPIQREYDPEFISEIMTEGRNDGFFVTYNHPIWSLESKDEYGKYHGMHAMEMVNYGCVTEGYDDRNGTVYDDILRGGERIFCVATDDNHNKFPKGHPRCDSFGGFTVIKAEQLEYGAVADALLKGNFYASEGPEIKELYFEDGHIHVKTSEAEKIIMQTSGRHYRIATAEKVGDTITEADFNVSELNDSYVRFTVYDSRGKGAYTNAYFLDTLTTEQ